MFFEDLLTGFVALFLILFGALFLLSILISVFFAINVPEYSILAWIYFGVSMLIVAYSIGRSINN